MLLRGYRVHYTRAKAWTEVPTTLGRYLRQQTRWGKSHWRELLWTWRALPRQPLYLAYDWLLTLLLPFLLLIAAAHAFASAAAGQPILLAALVAATIGMGAVRGALCIAATGDFRFLYLALFSFFHLLVNRLNIAPPRSP